MQEAKWYYMDCRGQRQGPVGAADIVAAYRRSDLLRDGLVWREGMPQWSPLIQVENELGVVPADHAVAPPPLPGDLRNMAAAKPSRSIDCSDIVYAGFVRRWAALFLDQIILSIPLIIFALLLAIPLGLFSTGTNEKPGVMIQGIYLLIWLIAAPLYYAGLESSTHQATFGKRALGIKVTDNLGERLSFSHALGRWFAAALSYLTLYIGFLMAAFTDRKRALHDIVASTLVVDRWAYTEFPERQQRSASGCLIAIVICFALIIPVTAILAAIAIPAYQDYTIRAQISEGESLADGSKTAVAEYFNNFKTYPRDNTQAGVAQATSITGNYVSSLRIEDGTISITYSATPPQHANPQIDGKVLQFQPSVSDNGVSWSCRSNMPAKYLPPACR